MSKSVDASRLPFRPQDREVMVLAPAPASPPAGVIYFIQAEQGGPIKIGYTQDPRRRLATLQIGCPVELVIRTTVPADREEEERLHRTFERQRLHGEWFEPSPALLELAGGGRDATIRLIGERVVPDRRAVLSDLEEGPRAWAPLTRTDSRVLDALREIGDWVSVRDLRSVLGMPADRGTRLAHTLRRLRDHGAGLESARATGWHVDSPHAMSTIWRISA